MKSRSKLLQFICAFIACIALTVLIFPGCNDAQDKDKIAGADTATTADGATGSTGPDTTHTCKPGKWPCPGPNELMYNAPIAGIDLEKEIGMKGRNVRLRYWVVGPGGKIGQHYHDKRPAIVYFLEGEAHETKKDVDSQVKVRTVSADQVVFEQSGIQHWWVNQSGKMVRLFAVDIVPNSIISPGRTPGIPLPADYVFKGPTNPDNVKIEELGSHDLGQQFPDVSEVKDYLMRSRRITLLPHQKTAVQNSKGNPSVTYVIRGDMLEHRDDEEISIRRRGDCTTASNGVSYYWENPTSEPVVLFVVDFVKKDKKGS